MRLFHKGILLIAIPIIGQFIFVFVLVGAYRTSEELAYRDQHYRTETQELMGTLVLLYKSVTQLSAYGYANHDAFLLAFDRQYEQLVRKAELMTLLDHEQHSATTKEASDTLRKTLRDLHEVRQVLALKKEAFGVDTQKALIAEFSTDLSDTLAVMEKLIAARAKSGGTDTSQIERSRWIFLGSIVSGFSINMILSAALLFFYARDFATRFTVILDNTMRVPKGMALNPRLAGDDEIGRLDKVLHDMNDAIKEAEARKEQFMSMVSHDMRSPLTSIQLTMEMVSGGVFGAIPAGLAGKLTDAGKLVRRLSRLVNDILDFDKIRAGKLDLRQSTINVDEALYQTLTELEPLSIAARVELICHPSNLEVVADGERLSQVLVNLVANAIKFSPINTSVEVGSSEEKDMVRIFVRDHGPGVPEAFRKVIFLPFEQIPDDQRPQVGSTGLGLSISKMLVEVHGGQIGVDVPEDGVGSIFWFTLPIAVVEEI